MLAIDLTQSGTEDVLFLNGRITIDSSPELRNRLLAVLHQETPETVTVNMEGVPYLDCSGIATLIEALKIARQHNKTLLLKGLQAPISHFLQATGVLSLFETNGDVSAQPKEKVQ